MEAFKKSYDIKWADLDPNRHLRHTAYNDYAAQIRIVFLNEMGLPISLMETLNVGPILFREETKFLREVGMQDVITVTCAVKKMRPDGSRWSFFHEVYRQDGVKAAEITVEGAWMDLDKRKLTVLPADIIAGMQDMPKTDDFQLEQIPVKK